MHGTVLLLLLVPVAIAMRCYVGGESFLNGFALCSDRDSKKKCLKLSSEVVLVFFNEIAYRRRHGQQRLPGGVPATGVRRQK